VFAVVHHAILPPSLFITITKTICRDAILSRGGSKNGFPKSLEIHFRRVNLEPSLKVGATQ
jgi:hypothetical protein